VDAKYSIQFDDWGFGRAFSVLLSFVYSDMSAEEI
jgi:hypothetical protein